ncbi:lytic transglycosylase domain-containing protein [Pseudomonas syringae]|uniref:lytic transglycosylase domain-containing protein n=1 Tax=Pseudomonas syringae TaxID=317 RepID=UPI0013736D9F|nr:lytic transglycosylase domain-containing protein [Pseudomonas syringae]NAP32490.1 transglycosylase SLT domain-containing protein [Pseudomonas syringae]
MKVLALLLAGLLSPVAVLAADGEDFNALAARCAPGVHINTLSPIVKHESRAKTYDIHVNGKHGQLARQPSSREEAIATATWLKTNGYSFDSGLGQVNSTNLDWLGMSIPDLFDPCKNLAGAAQVITYCYKRAKPRYADEQSALHAALSCYNTGNEKDGIANGYVAHVIAAANTTIDVPALIPSAPVSVEPIRLKASGKAAAQVNPAQPKKKPDGIGDAFSHSIGDAFSQPSVGAFAPSEAASDKSGAGTLDSKKDEPVMLKSE